MSPTLDELVDHAAFLSAEHQAHVADLHGEDRWDVDFAAERFWFTSPAGTVTECGVQFLGGAAPGPASWLWGWENINGYPDGVLVAARAARDSGVPELSTAELPLESVQRARTTGPDVVGRSPVLDDELPYRLVLAAKAVTRRYVHYSPVVQGGTQLWMLIDIPGFALPPLDVPRLARVLGEGLRSVRVSDHRAAVESYAGARGLVVQEVPSGVDVGLSGGHLTIEFDEANRIVRMSGEAG